MSKSSTFLASEGDAADATSDSKAVLHDVDTQAILPRIVRLERKIDAAHSELRAQGARLSVIETTVRGVQAEAMDFRTHIAIVTDGYETIIREVRNTRTELEALITKQAKDRLMATERHGKIMAIALKGVFLLGALTVAASALLAIATGEPVQNAAINLLRGIFGMGS